VHLVWFYYRNNTNTVFALSSWTSRLKVKTLKFCWKFHSVCTWESLLLSLLHTSLNYVLSSTVLCNMLTITLHKIHVQLHLHLHIHEHTWGRKGITMLQNTELKKMFGSKQTKDKDAWRCQTLLHSPNITSDDVAGWVEKVNVGRFYDWETLKKEGVGKRIRA